MAADMLQKPAAQRRKMHFGWYGLVHPHIVVSKYTKLLEIGGKIVIDSKLPIGAITIGFLDITIFDVRYERSIWCNSGIIEFKGSAHLGQGTRITNRGILTIGEKFGISAN